MACECRFIRSLSFAFVSLSIERDFFPGQIKRARRCICSTSVRSLNMNGKQLNSDSGRPVKHNSIAVETDCADSRALKSIGLIDLICEIIKQLTSHSPTCIITLDCCWLRWFFQPLTLNTQNSLRLNRNRAWCGHWIATHDSMISGSDTQKVPDEKNAGDIAIKEARIEWKPRNSQQSKRDQL